MDILCREDIHSCRAYGSQKFVGTGAEMMGHLDKNAALDISAVEDSMRIKEVAVESNGCKC